MYEVIVRFDNGTELAFILDRMAKECIQYDKSCNSVCAHVEVNGKEYTIDMTKVTVILVIAKDK